MWKKRESNPHRRCTLGPKDASITCSSGLIECFVFASIGAVGGSCSGDPFKEDSTNQWDYMPLSVTWR